MKTSGTQNHTLFTTSTLSGVERYWFGFNSQEKEDEIYGEGNTYSAEYWMYDARLGRRWNIDPVDQISISNYAVLGNNPIMMIDVQGDRPVPINDVLSYYGYDSKETQLFPPPSPFTQTISALRIATSILFVSNFTSLTLEVIQESRSIKNNYYQNIKDADISNVIKFNKNLKEIESKITSEIKVINSRIEELKNLENETGNSGFHQQEIASQTKQRWELEYQLNTVQHEISATETIMNEHRIEL